jgi:Immunoglobulin I-set domain
MLAPVSSASASSFTWSGRSTTTEDWSEVENWEGLSTPRASSEIGTLAFPRLTSFACEDERGYHPCYYSENDIGGLSAESIQIDDGEDYEIWGDELTLGSGGLSATPGAAASEPTGDIVEMPLHLSSSQAWSVVGRGDSEFAYSNLLLAGNLSGSGSALAVDISEGAGFYLAEDNTEVGPVKIEGADTGKAGVLNGFVSLIEADLNSSDGQPVELSHIYFGGSGSVGPLSTNDAELAVGTSYYPAEAIEATSAKLDPASLVSFEISHAGVAAAEDNSELISNGAVALGDAAIEVVVRPPEEGAACPALVNGQTYTFVSTTGTLSGSFANVPEHGAEIPVRFAKACTPTSQKLLISYSESGGAQTVIGTVESGEKAPEVTNEPSSVEVVKGEEATFEASASGVPTPTVQWELSTNGGGVWSLVGGATSDTLTVASANTSESGDEYRAVFTNSAGKAETTTATLTVHAPPKVTKEPTSVDVVEGKEAMFEASASGVPTPTVQWELSINGGATWSVVGGATSDTLTVASANTSESGHEYRAVFTNSAGKAQTTAATLTVTVIPEVTKDPSSVEILEGEEATFEASASGVPTPSVQWELSTNGGATWNPLGGATSDSLTVASAKTSESGDEYRALFTNSAGKAETTAATLTVNVVPMITKDPSSVEVLEGEAATFEASASGMPSPTVQWELSTSKGATWSPVGGATSDTLKVVSAVESESGDEYRAVFTSSVGKAETTEATLTVESKLLRSEKEAARKKQEEEVANAAAKKRQEEEAAKGGVLGVKEGAPDATIASTSLHASASGVVIVKVTCPAGVSRCTGTVTLRTLNAVSASAAGATKSKGSILTLASGSFNVPGGGVKTLALHLSAKARALIARLHVLRVRAAIVAHDPTGGIHTGQAIATLRAAKAKHGKG